MSESQNLNAELNSQKLDVVLNPKGKNLLEVINIGLTPEELAKSMAIKEKTLMSLEAKVRLETGTPGLNSYQILTFMQEVYSAKEILVLAMMYVTNGSK